MKTLIIAEKPDMGRHISAVIEPRAINKRTYLEGDRHIVTWAIGHLITLAEPETYSDRYKRWNLHDLPIIPEKFILTPYARTLTQLNTIAELAKRADQLVNACDAGREGQYIFYLIQQYLGLAQPVRRLWISDLTPETIRAGFNNLRNAEDYEYITKAAKARSEADWIIGMNASRAFTTKHHVLLSVGRVQTPVLALIYDRQKQIESFDSLSYYDVIGNFSQSETRYMGIWQGERITRASDAQTIVDETSSQTGEITSIVVKESKEYPHKLFDLTTLQRDANAKYGFTAKKTLDLAQNLYEKHKAITYPRTNSNYVTEHNIPDMHRALTALKNSTYLLLVQEAVPSYVHRNNVMICNNSKVEDHHAILPTTKLPVTMTPEENKIYDLIIRRFLSHFFPPALYKMHTIITEVNGHSFRSLVKEQLQLGWKKVYSHETKESAEDNDVLETAQPFHLDVTQKIINLSSVLKEKQTQPPKAYTEGTLLKAMESAGKKVEDDELREVMKDSGLGTPATRASTIERLKQVEYIRVRGKRIEITQKGRTAIEVIRQAGVELLTSPSLTGQWERRLTEISRGAAEDAVFVARVKQFAQHIVNQVRQQKTVARSAFENQMIEKSPHSVKKRKKSVKT